MKSGSESLVFALLGDKHENYFQRTPRTASLPSCNITLNCKEGGSSSLMTETELNHKNRDLFIFSLISIDFFFVLD